jgi:hypothetical protein
LCRSFGPRINANGPAVELVSVTRRKHRHESVPVDQKTVTVQGGYGVVFACPGTSCLRYTCVALQGLLRAGYESRYCYFINTTGAVGLQIYHCPVTEAGYAKTMTSLLILPSVLVFSKVKRTGCVIVPESRFAQGWQSLQMVLIVRFCIFFLIQNREFPYASVGGANRSRGHKCLVSEKNRRPSLYRTLIVCNTFTVKIYGCLINTNGPAIWGGCVTRRNSGRPLVLILTSRSPSAGKGGYGALFAVRVQILLSITRVAVQV